MQAAQTTIRTLLLCLAAGLPAAAAGAELAARDARLLEGLRAMAAGNLRAALSSLRAVPRGGLETRLLEARAHVNAGQHAEAARIYREVMGAAPKDHPAAAKARFGLADCLARQGDFETAEGLFAEGLAWLQASERSGRVARRLVELGDERLEPAAPGRAAEPGRAEQLYRAALPLAEEPALRTEIERKIGLALEGQNQPARAAGWYAELLQREPPPPGADELMHRAAEARILQGDLPAARRHLRDLTALHPRSAHARDADFLLSRAYGLPRPQDAQHLALGQAALRRFVAAQPAHPRALEARLDIALAPLHLNRHAEAEDELRALLRSDSEELLASARYHLGEVLASQDRFDEAVAAFQDYLKHHPAHERWAEAHRGIERARLGKATQAEREKRWKDAAASFEDFADRHPASASAPDALLRAARARVEDKDLDGALGVLALLTSKFARHEKGQEGLVLSGEIHERRGDVARAKQAYEQARGDGKGSRSSVAAQRLAEMETPSLLIESPENFTSRESPGLTWHARNLEGVELRAYRLVAEDFFRDRLGMDALDQVDITLCGPDLTWSVPVQGYRPYVLSEQRVALGLPRPGLYLIGLGAGKLSATTAVLVSDLALVTKVGHRELLVLAQDRVRLEPAGDVKLWVSDGQRVVAEGRTDAQGALRVALPDEVDGSQLMVLGVRGEHVAWAGGGAPLASPAEVLTRRALVLSDRPVYRPGEEVRLAGVFRDAKDGRFLSAAGQTLQLIVSDPRGRLLYDSPVRLDEFGVFQDGLRLTPDAAVGHYGVTLHHPQGGESFSAAFQVEAHRRLPFSLDVRLDRSVVARGQEITGSLRVRHAHGQPAEDLEVSTWVEGLTRLETARTDPTGRVPFRFPTRAYEENTQLTLRFRLPGSFQQAEARVLVAATDLGLRLEVGQAALFAGQPFGLAIRALGPDGAPRAAELGLEALRLTPQGGQRRVFEQRLSVPAGGLARVELGLEEPGAHLVRVRGLDGAGEPVVAELAVRVQGAEDGPRLRLVAERAELVPGRPFRLELESALAARSLVWLTTETDRVLSHRAVLAGPGRTALELPWLDEFAPNFRVAAAAHERDRLHLTARELQVNRALTVEVRSDRERYEPGEEAQLTVVVRDADGRPADARVLVSVLDVALLEAFPDLTPSLTSVFDRRRALAELPTLASNTHRFLAVAAVEVEQAEVQEIQGSAAMAALRSRRRAMTDQAIGVFDQLAERDSVGLGGLGTRGYGAGGGGLSGYGRGAGSAMMRMGKAEARDGKDGRWRTNFDEAALFRADVRTGPDGVAGLSVKLPDGLSRWRVTARAVTRDTLVGEKRHEILTARDFWARLDLPPELEAGDRVAPVAQIWNDTPRALEAALELRAGGDTRRATLQVPAHGHGRHVFPALGAERAGEPLLLELQAEADGHRDRLRLEVPVRPRGVRVEQIVQGRLERRESRRLVLAEGLADPRLSVRLGTRLSRFFLGDCPGCGPEAAPIVAGPQGVLLDLAILELLGSEADQGMRAGLEGRLKAGLLELVAQQNDEGGFGWGPGGETRVETTAAALEALARARPLAARIGWRVPQAELAQAAQLLTTKLAELAPEDFLGRAEGLHALAWMGEASVPSVQLHRLHRLRRELGLGAQALLGLTWLALGRPEQAAEVASALDDPLAESAGRRWAPSGWLSDLDRARALQLLAQVRPADPRVARGLAWLHQGGRALGWGSPRLAAAALRTIARLEDSRAREVRQRIALTVNGRPAGEVELTGPGALAELAVDPALLRPGENEFSLALEGSGAAWFAASLSAHRQAGPDQAELKDAPVRIQRRVEPVPAPYRGQPIEAGFSVVGHQVKRWTQVVERMPAGTALQVHLSVQRDFPEPLDHCVLEERIPPGLALEPGSARGGFSHLRVEGRRLFFHLGASPARQLEIAYRLQAVEPGEYSFAPTRLWSLAHPELQVLGPSTPFRVDPPGAPRPEVRPTPDELYARGFEAARLQDHAQALIDLEALWEGYELQLNRVAAVLERLLFASIERRDLDRILKYFELTKERNPDLVVPFDKIGTVQAAYRALRAHEGGLHLGRGLAEALFLRQIRTVGELEAQDELAEAIRLLGEQLGAAPDLGVAARASYAFSQVLYGRADRIAEGEPLPGFDRPGLLREVERFMAGFLARFPADPEAPPAVFSLASALLEADQPAGAADWCQVGLERHSDSDLAPAIAYLKAFAHFRQGDYGESLRLCRRVAEDEDGQDEHRDMARYIMAQIHHARGELGLARQLYQEVRDRFRDARETLEELDREHLTVQDVVVVPPGETARLPLTARNVREVQVRVYRVDLMKLYLVKRSLRDLAEVNLAGVKPIQNQVLKLQARPGAQEERLPLSLPGKGAYLVLVRAGDRTQPSLVLVGGLGLAVTELSSEGRVRVTALDGRGRTIPGAQVQLKGEQDERFQVGQTDLRGVFLASGIQGPATVIALHQGAYGLYRGRLALEGEETSPEAPPPGSGSIDFDDSPVQGNLYRNLRQERAPPGQQANEFFKQEVKGMSAQQAK
jgi:hypothetical protein